MPEGPRESSKEAPPKVVVQMEPEKLKTYGDARSKSFGEVVAREKAAAETELSLEENLVSKLTLDPASTPLGRGQREFQFLVEMRARAEKEGTPMSDDFKRNYVETVMMLNAVDRNPTNKEIYQRLWSI